MLSFFAHSSNVNNLLEGLDGVLKNWLDRLHDTESSFHIINLWLHTFNGLHLSGNFNEWLSVIKSLQDSGSERFLDVFDGGSFGNGGVSISSGFGSLGGGKSVGKLGEELIFNLDVNDITTAVSASSVLC